MKALLSLVLGSMLVLSAAATDHLQLAQNEKLAEQSVAAAVLAQIYQRAGMAFDAEALPPARANALASSGARDGEVARIFSYGQKYPSELRVEPSYYSLTTSAFAVDGRGVVIQSKADLARYRVGVIRGVQHSADATEGLSNVTEADSAESLFAMLVRGRFDVALDTGINGQHLLAKERLTNVREVAVLARLPLFHYLHVKNKGLAPRLGAVITALRDSGELDQLIRTAERDYLARD